jgi:Putative peptidoglycan binding domain
MTRLLRDAALVALMTIGVPAMAQTTPPAGEASKPGEPAKPGTEAGVTQTPAGTEGGTNPNTSLRDVKNVPAKPGTEAGPAPTGAAAQSQTGHTGTAGSPRAHTEAVSLSRREVEQAQQKLKAEGFYHGRIDGIAGRETKQALSAYQKRNGLRQTATLDGETRNSLMGQRTSGSGASTSRSSSAPR